MLFQLSGYYYTILGQIGGFVSKVESASLGLQKSIPKSSCYVSGSVDSTGGLLLQNL